MAIYLKKFETMSQYNAYTADTENFILPNVSLTVDNSTVHYNPSSPTPPTPTETRLVAKINVTDTSNPTMIMNKHADIPSCFSAIEIDGVEQPSVTTGYTFSTTGEHTVKYTLTDPTSIYVESFYNCSSITSIIIPDSVTSIGRQAFMSCYGLTSVTFGSGVTSIDECTFYDCPSLDAASIAAIEAIDPNAFYCD